MPLPCSPHQALAIPLCLLGALALSASSNAEVPPSPGTSPVAVTSSALASGYGMRRIEPGLFQMGSVPGEAGREPDEVKHEVRITRAFWMGEREVTQALYKEIMGSEPSIASYKGISLLGPTLPVQGVSYLDAVEFCNRLSQRDGLSPAYSVSGSDVRWNAQANGYRLPTEAEWEYAARAGSDRTYTGASGSGGLCQTSNVADATARRKWPSWSGSVPCTDGFAAVAPVGSLSPSPWGLYDTSGNVAEWVWDWYGPYPVGPVEDPRGPDTGYEKLVRGGSWANNGTFTRLAQRSRQRADTRDMYYGLRVARNLTP